MRILTVLVLVFAFAAVLPAQTNLLFNSGVEMRAPGFWQSLNADQGGSDAIWASDTAANGRWGLQMPSEYSFKVVKPSTTTDAVGWQSFNNADLYWNNAAGNVTYTLQVYAKTEGVNTNPAADDTDAKFGMMVTFLTDADVIIAAQFVAVDQSVASTNWQDYEGAVLVPSEPAKVIIELVGGKDATGTAWFDNVNVGTDPWSMGVFNGDAETPLSWMNWSSSDKIGYANVVPDTAYAGMYSVLLEEKDDEDDEMVFYSEPVPVTAGKWYKIGVWMKTENLNSDTSWLPSNITGDRDVDRAGINFFFHKGPIGTAWDLVGGDQFFYVDQRTGKENEDWKHFAVVVLAPEEAEGVSMRSRFNPFVKGKVWYDNYSIEELEVQPQLLTNPDVEIREPNFWHSKFAGTESMLTWASDTAANGRWGLQMPSEYSFKIDKLEVTGDEVAWESEDNADLFWNNAAGNATYTLQFYSKTEGVNTAPADDTYKMGMRVKFLDDGGGTIAEQFIPVDQTTANTTWRDNEGAILVGSEPAEVIIELVAGKNSTGTVWFDNINVGTDPWSMGAFNGDAETPVGWMNWNSSDKIGYSNVVPDTAHSGMYSVLLNEKDDEDDEMVFYSEPVPAEAGEWYKIGVWMKTEGVNTDTTGWYASNIVPDRDADRVAINFFYHKDPIATAWDLVGGDQFFYLDQRDGKENEDWKEYVVISQAPEEAAGMSMRARFNPFATGKVYYDDFSIEKVLMVVSAIESPSNTLTLTPIEYELGDNYPNPFNPETIFEYRVPEAGRVHIAIFNVLGQKVRTLIDQEQHAGLHHVMWDGKDDTGSRLSTGMYFYQLRGDNAVITKKMTMIK